MKRFFSHPVGRAVFFLLIVSTLPATADAQQKPRARDLGVPFDGVPGPLNAITDVAGVLVGHTTLIRGEGALRIGEGPVRTGVTAILPRGDDPGNPVFGGWFALNGNGEMTGTTWVEESGFLEGPIAITNTHSVGTVRDAIIAWQVENDTAFQRFSLPVVGETYDGALNDINGFHVKAEHVFAALDTASSGPVAEGNVGGGTAMRCLGFKCGIGTSSRAGVGSGNYTVGVLVQANFGAGVATIAGFRSVGSSGRKVGPSPTLPRMKTGAARSSSWWRPTRRFFLTSSRGSPAARRSALRAPEASPRTARETFSSPSRPPTPARLAAVRRPTSRS